MESDYRVLIVEAEERSREMLADLFQEAGYVVCARDGLEYPVSQ